jgi:hypothetical protein
VQPSLLTGIGLFIAYDRGSTVGVLRPGIGVDVYLSERVLIAPFVSYDWYFTLSGTEAPSGVYVGATLQYRF